MQACFESTYGPAPYGAPYAPYSSYGYGSCAAAQRVPNTYWRDRNTAHPAAAADLMSQNEWAFHGPCSGGYEWPLVTAVPYTPTAPYGVYSYGDYDRDHHWRNSDWWVDHDKGWVQQHHPNWVAQPKHQDNDHGRGNQQASKRDHGKQQSDNSGSHGKQQGSGHGENDSYVNR
jgi:hypothetical protein